MRAKVVVVEIDTGAVVNKSRKEVLEKYDVIKKERQFDYDNQVIIWYWLVKVSKQLKLKF